MKAPAVKVKEQDALLTNMAESIGSTMGAIVGRANAAQKALTRNTVARAVKRNGKKVVKKGNKKKQSK